MTDPKSYPRLKPFLAEDIDDIGVESISNALGKFLLITASAGDSTDQFLFEETDEGLADVTERAGEILGTLEKSGFQGAASAAMHGLAFATAKDQVGKFDTHGGPGGGSFACVWSLRKILHSALGYWVTRTDSTEVFGVELKQDYYQSSAEDAVLPGGIIISSTVVKPGTTQRVVGHIGILGEGDGDDRLIYSNSSKNKVWLQDYTVKSWRDRQLPRGLEVLFYPLPHY